ncbi:MAG: hypothetical protein AAGI91_08930 [Bacteroidota bacterium]
MKTLFFWLFPLVILTDCIGPLVQVGSLHAGHLKYGILLLATVLTAPHWRLTLPVVAVLGFLVYVTGLAFLASDWGNSLNGAMRLWLALSMYPVAVSVLRSWQDVTAFLRLLMVGAFVLVLTFGAAQVYPWGWEGYMRGSGFSYGGMGVYATYAMVYLTLAAAVSLPLVRSKRRRLLALAVYGLAAMIVLVSFRRSAMAGLAVGGCALVVLGGVRLSMGRTLAGLGVLIPIAAACFFLFGEKVTQLYASRAVEGVHFEMASRYGRVAETEKVWRDFTGGSPRHMLFGTEFSNATDIFEWKLNDRRIHVDYNVILDGAGAVGLGAFLLVYLLIALRFRASYRRLLRSRLATGLHALFWALLAASLVFSASNQLWVTVPYGLFFALLGALQRAAEVLPAKRAAAARAGVPLLRAPLPLPPTTPARSHARPA